MKDLLSFLDGRRTYVVCALAIVYLVFCQVRGLPPDQLILGIFQFLGLTFLRSGFAKSAAGSGGGELGALPPGGELGVKPKGSHWDKSVLLATAVFWLSVGAVVMGCAQLAPGADKVMVRTEQTIKSSHQLVDSFLRFEHVNRASLPYEVTAAADRLRVEFPPALDHALALKRTYGASRSKENADALGVALDVLVRLQEIATQAMAQAKPNASPQ